MEEEVILVDIDDKEIGRMPKMEAHILGKLHRAFSVFIFNTKGELLLQQRAFDKYHSGGEWTNTCCSHPKPGEVTINAAHRRLQEEMGMQSVLSPVFSFSYRAILKQGIVEHEYDHVFFGVTDQVPIVNPTEVNAYQYIKMALLQEDLTSNPDKYTAWLKICFDRVMECYTDSFEL